MVTLNKPSAGDTNWATPVNDNWTAIEGAIDQAISQGRLTLSSGNPIYNPLPKTPSSTDTVADTVTFAAAHGWTTGTMVTPATTIGGLTAGTTYYINAVSSTVVSFHTTLANAEAGTPKVDLTASVTSEIRPFGVSRTTVYFTPYKGNRIGIYNGSTWKMFSFSEQSLSISALTANTNYDLFVYDSSGTVTLEALAWSTDTARATDLVIQDGIYVKSGDTTRRYIGTIRILATTGQCEDSVLKRYMWNYYNRLPRKMVVYETAGAWSYGSAAWRAANNNTANRVQLVMGVNEDPVEGAAHGVDQGTSGNFQLVGAGVGLDSTTVDSSDVGGGGSANNTTGLTDGDGYSSHFVLYTGIGFHFLQWLEYGGSTLSFYGTSGPVRTGLKATIQA